MIDRPLIALIEAIILCPSMQSLWQVKDRGMPVFAHTIDVALICLDSFPDWQERFPSLNLRAVAIASLLHDLDKLAARGEGEASHSHVMSTDPERALRTAIDVLQAAQWHCGVTVENAELDEIWHIVVSHHGRWGKIQPQTPEAALVHEADFKSASAHRLTPIDATDILPLLGQDLRWREIASRLEVTTSVLRQRLREACKAENVAEPNALLDIWRRRGYVVTGTLERMRQLEEVRGVIEVAREAPACVVKRVEALSEAMRVARVPSGR